mmetsp:Transcript_5977/g.17287  ORF Transcript_5977/g.17287 Transcript_5977/m.17287 type:complete len:202 (-) Transcript_5977:59-664(-)
MPRGPIAARRSTSPRPRSPRSCPPGRASWSPALRPFALSAAGLAALQLLAPRWNFCRRARPLHPRLPSARVVVAQEGGRRFLRAIAEAAGWASWRDGGSRVTSDVEATLVPALPLLQLRQAGPGPWAQVGSNQFAGHLPLLVSLALSAMPPPLHPAQEERPEVLTARGFAWRGEGRAPSLHGGILEPECTGNESSVPAELP